MEFDCGITNENNWFRYRAAAIIVEKGHVLFVSNAREDYYYSVGGAVHMNETAEDAIRREVLEETGVEYEIDRLAVVHENFFDGNGGLHEGMHCHEIAMYFLMKPRGTMELHSDSYTHGVRERMRWLPVEEIDKYRAFPSFMGEYLRGDCKGIAHIVTDERDYKAVDSLRRPEEPEYI